MEFIIATKEWISEHVIIPLPTMRKSNDGSKCVIGLEVGYDADLSELLSLLEKVKGGAK